MKIIKRDGRVVDYDRQKIAVAIEKAARAYPENIYTRMFYEIHGNPDERIDEEGLAKVFEEDKIAENIEQVKITNLVRDYYERKKSR